MAYTSESPAIKVEGLQKSYGALTVLDGVNFSVSRGSIFALLGQNGAGKTTTINILSTLLRPDAGRAFVAGYDVVQSPRDVHRAIAVTGQFAALDGLLTGRENLRMMARLNHFSRRRVTERVRELLHQFDLVDAADRPARTYSGGMRRRLDIAIGLLTRPEVMFLDEPTTGLDPRSRMEVWRLVRDLADDGVTIVLTTQYLEEADSLADTIAVLHHGRIIAEGSAASLKQQVGTDVIDISYADGTVEAIPTNSSISDVRRILSRVTESPRSAVRIELRQPTLDDVFLRLTDTHADPTTTESTNA